VFITCENDIESIVEGAMRSIQVSFADIVTVVGPVYFIKVFGIEFLANCISS
jgi:hypothetical protein